MTISKDNVELLLAMADGGGPTPVPAPQLKALCQSWLDTNRNPSAPAEGTDFAGNLERGLSKLFKEVLPPGAQGVTDTILRELRKAGETATAAKKPVEEDYHSVEADGDHFILYRGKIGDAVGFRVATLVDATPEIAQAIATALNRTQ